MAKDVADILADMHRNPAGVRFVDACKVVTHYFGAPRQHGTSHKVWKMPWPSDPRVNMQEGKGGKAKPYQVRQALAAIDMLLAHRPTKAPVEPASSQKPPKARKQGRS